VHGAAAFCARELLVENYGKHLANSKLSGRSRRVGHETSVPLCLWFGNNTVMGSPPNVAISSTVSVHYEGSQRILPSANFGEL
jgi:hypothetical protein